jgi:hypothetical protein
MGISDDRAVHADSRRNGDVVQRARDVLIAV